MRIMSNFYHLSTMAPSSWIRGLLYISWAYKFPLPPQKLIDFFGFSAELASFVAISEIGAGFLLILGGFLKGHVGNLVTRFAAGVIIIVMTVAFTLAHSDWFITPKLFMSEQIFLMIIGLYFFIKGNN